MPHGSTGRVVNVYQCIQASPFSCVYTLTFLYPRFLSEVSIWSVVLNWVLNMATM